MQVHPLDPESCEALLSGSMTPAEAPPDLHDVAQLLAAVRLPAEEGELGDEEATAKLFVAAMTAEAVVEEPALAAEARREGLRTMIGINKAKVIPVIAGAVLAAGTSVAAATGGFSHSGAAHSAPPARAVHHAARSAGHEAGSIRLAGAGHLGSMRFVLASASTEAHTGLHFAALQRTGVPGPRRPVGDPGSRHRRHHGSGGPGSGSDHVEGVVTTVNGSTSSGMCGTSGGTGSFVVAGGEGGDSQTAARHHDGGMPVTVNVSSSTTFEDQADSSPGFQDVCVGSNVDASGTFASDGSLTAANVEVQAESANDQVGGMVTSVNGSSTAGMCGTSGATGSFVVANGDEGGDSQGGDQGGDSQGANGAHDDGGGPVTVNVTSSTTFEDQADSSPGFQDVCVGSHVHASGTFASDGSLSATTVAVQVEMAEVGGMVTSVNGSSTAGMCGTSGATGSFVVTGGDSGGGGGGGGGDSVTDGGSPVTVNVTSSTTFEDQADSSPGFQDVCVGSFVHATGTLASDGSLTAANVDVHVEMGDVGGMVTSVNGSSTAGMCGTSGATGSFVVTGGDSSGGGGGDSVTDGGGSPVTVNVTSSTTFEDEADSSPGFQDVCVGSFVHASGMFASDGSLTATNVSVHVQTAEVQGTVTSVNGNSASGTCGSGTSGSFVVTGGGGGGDSVTDGGGSPVTVNVTSSTTFEDQADSSPSFHDVCVGSQVGARGTLASDGSLTATNVAVFSGDSGGGGDGGGGGGGAVHSLSTGGSHTATRFA
jgi:hypothetical protein